MGSEESVQELKIEALVTQMKQLKVIVTGNVAHQQTVKDGSKFEFSKQPLPQQQQQIPDLALSSETSSSICARKEVNALVVT